MKNKFKIYTLITLSLMLLACEKDVLVNDPGNGFIQLGDVPETFGENDAAATVIQFELGTNSNPNGVEVNYTVTSDDPSRYNISSTSGSITIPAGEFTAEIEIMPIDNILVDGDIDITIELLDSDLPIGINGKGINRVSSTLTLVDNDCPIDSNSLVGTFSVQEVFTSGTNEGLSLATAFGEIYQVEITQAPNDPSGTSFILNNSIGFNQFFVPGTVMTVSTCPGTLSIDQANIALFADLTIENSSYSEENSRIVMQGPLGGFGPFEIILTRLP